MGRVVLFGATGYTGRLVAEAMVTRGLAPLLAGRSRGRLEALASELAAQAGAAGRGGAGGAVAGVAVADSADPASLRRLLGGGDVLVTTVGPFVRLGAGAVGAALEAGAHYVDSTGEAPFVRTIFGTWGAAAAGRCALLTAFGNDFVPGNLAGALALREAGPGARRLAVGYFVSGGAGASRGTRASSAGMVFERHHALRGGSLRLERGAARVVTLPVAGRRRPAITIGGTEALALPRIHPGLLEVETCLGWFGAATRPLWALSLGTAAIGRAGALGRAAEAGVERLARAGSTGPDAATRSRVRSRTVAVAADAGGRPLATVELHHGDPYEFTAAILAWAAGTILEGGQQGSGALGPVDGFGLDALEAGCRECGLERAR